MGRDRRRSASAARNGMAIDTDDERNSAEYLALNIHCAVAVQPRYLPGDDLVESVDIELTDGRLAGTGRKSPYRTRHGRLFYYLRPLVRSIHYLRMKSNTSFARNWPPPLSSFGVAPLAAAAAALSSRICSPGSNRAGDIRFRWRPRAVGRRHVKRRLTALGRQIEKVALTRGGSSQA